jgi:hypothetical protein
VDVGGGVRGPVVVEVEVDVGVLGLVGVVVDVVDVVEVVEVVDVLVLVLVDVLVDVLVVPAQLLLLLPLSLPPLPLPLPVLPDWFCSQLPAPLPFGTQLFDPGGSPCVPGGHTFPAPVGGP